MLQPIGPADLYTVLVKAAYLAVALCMACIVRPSQAVCPPEAMFVALGTEIRGFPLRANDTVPPCQIVGGANAVLGSLIGIGPDGSLHVSGFQTNPSGQLNVFAASASGTVAPLRTALTFSTDHVSLTTDPWGNDFVLARETVVFLPEGTHGEPLPLIAIPAGNVASIASDGDGNLLMAGWDDQGVFIKTLGTSLSKVTPPLLRTIAGSATGLYTGTVFWGHQPDLQIALDPDSQELYVYNASADHAQVQVLVFAARADGNVAPIRRLAGPATGISPPEGIGFNKIAVSSDGRLFVAEPHRRVLVFAPGAAGNVAPSQLIQDATSGTLTLDAQGGIAVRSCGCRLQPPKRVRIAPR